MARHSVVHLMIDDAVTLNQVMTVKEAMEDELRHIHNMQSVVIDIEKEDLEPHDHSEHYHSCRVCYELMIGDVCDRSTFP